MNIPVIEEKEHVTIELDISNCDVCGKDGLSISIDTSQEEYGFGRICLDCIKRYEKLLV